MIAAADHLEKLASGDFERGPLLDVSRRDSSFTSQCIPGPQGSVAKPWVRLDS